MKETWKDIKGYEGLYQVSNLGRVCSLPHEVLCRNKRVLHFDGKMLSLSQCRGGYLSVVLCKNGIPKTYRVNRLVANAFLPNKDNKPQVDHIDGCRVNNCAINLKWATSKENMNNPNTKYKRAKKVLQIKDGIILEAYMSITDAQKITGIKHIQSVCSGNRHTAGGYEWKYK